MRNVNALENCPKLTSAHMNSLANDDWSRAHDLILRVNGSDSIESFRVVTTEGLRDLLGCDRVSYNEIMTDGTVSILTWPTPKRWREMQDIYAKYGADHPAINPAVRIPLGTVIAPDSPRFKRDWHRSALYNEYFLPLGIRYQIGTTIAQEGGRRICIGLNRHRHDFGEREIALLAVLAPHLSQAWRRIEAAVIENGAGAGEAMRAVVLANCRSGRMRTLSPSAIRMLRRYFPDARKSDQLPDRIRRWACGAVAVDLAKGIVPPLVMPGTDGRLAVRAAGVREGETVLLLEHLPVTASARHHCFAELSPRENEIVSWLVDGKRNHEIASILGISPRTVEKHLERIFPRVGVETRAALVRLVFDRACR